MIVEDQSAAIACLADPASHGGAAVERIDTHGAVIFLAGSRAYKLKRAVRFAFLDYSTADKRRVVCEAEARLNRRTAPDLYQGVVPITEEADGALALDGAGRPVDWVVVMKRFDQDTLFDRMAARGDLTNALTRDLADTIADFHDKAVRRPDLGGRDGIAAVIDGNMATLRGESAGLFPARDLDAIEGAWRDALAARGELLDARRIGGRVRWCHGDLHLRNICLIDGRPTLFDGIEFSEAIACIDVLYDLAFLLMDLRHRDLGELASVVFNRYLGCTEDVAGLAALGLFQSLRAGVRAMVGAIEAGQSKGGEAAKLGAEARDYLALAFAFLEPPAPRLIAIGGLSGTGKSTLAAALAPCLAAPPGAVVLRSDLIRKRVFAARPEQRLGAEAYQPAASRAVYDRLESLAEDGLAAGQVVVLDAVFARPGERARAEAIARAAYVPFHGLWLEAPVDILRARIGARVGDPSDATAAVLDRQLDYDLGAIEWTRVDVSGTDADVIAAARRALEGA